MGSLQAYEMADAMTMEQGIEWHLTSNHYPPVPVTMCQPCIRAIEACNDGDHDRLIDLPEDVTFRGKTDISAMQLVESFHLDPWLEGVDM